MFEERCNGGVRSVLFILCCFCIPWCGTYNLFAKSELKEIY